MDDRFERIYLLKTKDGDIERLKKICEDYHIQDNGTFDMAAPFHFAWAFGPDGMIYISPTTFLVHKPDFNSIEEFEEYLDKFVAKN